MGEKIPRTCDAGDFVKPAVSGCGHLNGAVRASGRRVLHRRFRQVGSPIARRACPVHAPCPDLDHHDAADCHAGCRSGSAQA